MQLLAAEREARGAVRHHALALRGADGGAQIGLARQARRALPAFGRVERNDVVALLHAGHARPDIDDDAGALMAEDRREQAFGVGAGKRELVGVADAGGLHLDQDLAGFRSLEVDLGDLERLGLLHCDGGAGFHGVFLLVDVSARCAELAAGAESCAEQSHLQCQEPPHATAPERCRIPLEKPLTWRFLRRARFHFAGKPIVSMQSVTAKNLTEIEPSRKSAAARKAPFASRRSEPPHENVIAARRRNGADNQLREDMPWRDLNSSGSGQRREGPARPASRAARSSANARAIRSR